MYFVESGVMWESVCGDSYSVLFRSWIISAMPPSGGEEVDILLVSSLTNSLSLESGLILLMSVGEESHQIKHGRRGTMFSSLLLEEEEGRDLIACGVSGVMHVGP